MAGVAPRRLPTPPPRTLAGVARDNEYGEIEYGGLPVLWRRWAPPHCARAADGQCTCQLVSLVGAFECSRTERLAENRPLDQPGSAARQPTRRPHLPHPLPRGSGSCCQGKNLVGQATARIQPLSSISTRPESRPFVGDCGQVPRAQENESPPVAVAIGGVLRVFSRMRPRGRWTMSVKDRRR
jgi:hypothetical protein